MEFQGFTPEALDFLWGIRFNNNREWFSEHKSQYQRALYEPMKALAAELAPDFEHFPRTAAPPFPDLSGYADAPLHLL